MQFRIHALLMASALLCSGAARAQDAEVPEPAVSAPAVEPAIATLLDTDAHELIEGTNAFSLDLLRAVGQRDSNLIVSPASVSAAGGLAYRGAVGETARQLQQVMRYPFEPVRTLKASGAMMDTMSFSGPGRDLRTANALWLQDSMPLNEPFERDMATYAKAGFERANFKADPEAARRRINQWVSDATRENIEELLKKDQISTCTRTVLVNAIWFKADWLAPFTSGMTKTEPFTAIDGRKTPLRLMHQSSDFRALKRGSVSAIQLPYKGREVALVAFLPDDYDDLPRFEEKLTAKELANWFDALDRTEPRETLLSFPRFKLRWGTDLSTTLKAMGAPLAFSNDADFSNMARLPYPGGDPSERGLKISHVIHEATVEVDETGSEASAATAMLMDMIPTGRHRGPPPPPPFVFRADKPFLFLLRDLRTGLILFVGRYVQPEPN
ncbi:serpin family protein [Novosphingobium aquimarinum]|uniref:serpin family protein n=1 Tax=Novosphingobium aquimarinum TaxID=2682494 RepID=UPI0018DDC5F6|nr:serpin family protein [Novosphingobium aquimarinum]